MFSLSFKRNLVLAALAVAASAGTFALTIIAPIASMNGFD